MSMFKQYAPRISRDVPMMIMGPYCPWPRQQKKSPARK